MTTCTVYVNAQSMGRWSSTTIASASTFGSITHVLVLKEFQRVIGFVQTLANLIPYIDSNYAQCNNYDISGG